MQDIQIPVLAETEDTVTISRQSYNGACKALKMLHDKTYKADGYILVRAEIDTNRNGDYVSQWHLTKRTPYKSDTAIDVAISYIYADLDAIYGFCPDVRKLSETPYHAYCLHNVSVDRDGYYTITYWTDVLR